MSGRKYLVLYFHLPLKLQVLGVGLYLYEGKSLYRIIKLCNTFFHNAFPKKPLHIYKSSSHAHIYYQLVTNNLINSQQLSKIGSGALGLCLVLENELFSTGRTASRKIGQFGGKNTFPPPYAAKM